MSRTDLDPELRRLGEALRAATTIDLTRASEARRATSAGGSSGAGKRRARLRPRGLAGASLGLAGIAAALLLAFGGQSATPPPAAAAVTVTREADGSVLVHINTHSVIFVQSANDKLAAMGLDERILVGWYPGPAPSSEPVACTPMTGADAPSGPPVRVLLDTDGTGYFGADNTGAGSVRGAVHVECESFAAASTSAPGLPGRSADARSSRDSGTRAGSQ